MGMSVITLQSLQKVTLSLYINFLWKNLNLYLREKVKKQGKLGNV